MAIPSRVPAASRPRRKPAFRVLAVAVLVVSLGIEVLSCTSVGCFAMTSTARSAVVFAIESLQVCDDQDMFGALFDVPVLLPGAPCLLVTPAERWYLQQSAAFAPDGFSGAIDHPPQFRS
jgi:hypothetical protein